MLIFIDRVVDYLFSTFVISLFSSSFYFVFYLCILFIIFVLLFYSECITKRFLLHVYVWFRFYNTNVVYTCQ